MASFLASEALITDEAIELTGQTEIYLAMTADQAAQSLLYTRRLNNGNWQMGQSGRTVHLGNKTWAITQPRRLREAVA